MVMVLMIIIHIKKLVDAKLQKKKKKDGGKNKN